MDVFVPETMFSDDDSPIITIRLPLDVVRQVTDFLYREATIRNSGLDGFVIEDLRDQTAQNVKVLGL